MLILGLKEVSGFLSGLNFTTQTTETNKTALHAISNHSRHESHWLIHVYESLTDDSRFITMSLESTTPTLHSFLPSFLPPSPPYSLPSFLSQLTICPIKTLLSNPSPSPPSQISNFRGYFL